MTIFSKRSVYIVFGAMALSAVILYFAGSDINPFKKESAEPYEIESCGVERWDVKVLADPDASSVNTVPVNTTINALVHLTTPFPDPNMPRQPIEKQAYTVHCTLGEIKLESDGDYHLLMADSMGNTMIGEIPDPSCPATTNSLYFGDIIKCRQFIDKHYNVTTSFQNVGARVVLTGVAFVDPPHGQSDAAPNNIELHSILDVEYEPTHSSGIAEEGSSEIHISVYPNPIVKEATFRLSAIDQPMHSGAYLALFDMQGKEVTGMTWPANQTSVLFDRGSLNPGFYLYRVTDGNQVAYGKIMLE